MFRLRKSAGTVPFMELTALHESLPRVGVRIPRQVVRRAESAVQSFRMRNAAGQELTTFGWFVAEAMKEAGLDKPADLRRASGITAATVHRLLYETGKPKPETLAKLAPAINRSYGELLTRAGYGRPEQHVTDREPDPLAAELDRMLSDASRLTKAEKGDLRAIVNATLGPYRRRMTRRPA